MDNDPGAAAHDHAAVSHPGAAQHDGAGHPSEETRGCTCKASKCLKLYCVCFAAGRACGRDCACRSCHNNGHFPDQKKAAVEAILERNPTAFEPKVNDRSKHNKGCSCRKSGCLKRYCECFNAGVLCSDLCKCLSCKNFDGSVDLAPGTKPSATGSAKAVPAHMHNHAHLIQHQAQSHAVAPANPASRAHARAMSYNNYSQSYAHTPLSRQTPHNAAPSHQMHRYAPPPHTYTHHAHAEPATRHPYHHAPPPNSDPSAAPGNAASGSAASSGYEPGNGASSAGAGAWRNPAEFLTDLAGQSDDGRGAVDPSLAAKDRLLLRYGKRGISHSGADVQQPPAKRVLFQRGPAFKSRFGVLGSPGGLHYRTTALEEDRPENLKSAAAKALNPAIVTAAEEDTARLLTMFAQSAAGTETEAQSSLPHAVSSKHDMGGGGLVNPVTSTRKNVGESDLYCEEEKLDEDEEAGAAFLKRNNGGVSGVDGSLNAERGENDAADDRNYVTEDDDDDDDDEEDDARMGGSRDVSSSGTGVEGRGHLDGVSDAFRGRLHSRASGALGSTGKKPSAALRPPWYAAAERSALEHCAAVLRKIANSPPIAGGPSTHRRRSGKQPPGGSSRFHDNVYATQAPVSTTAPPVNGQVIPGSPPLPRG